MFTLQNRRQSILIQSNKKGKGVRNQRTWRRLKDATANEPWKWHMLAIYIILFKAPFMGFNCISMANKTFRFSQINDGKCQQAYKAGT